MDCYFDYGYDYYYDYYLDCYILITTSIDMCVSQNWGYLFGGPYNKDYSILGSILGSPNSGKLPYCALSWTPGSAGWYRFPVESSRFCLLHETWGVGIAWALCRDSATL